MPLLKSAALVILTFGAFIQNLISPVPTNDGRLTTDISADKNPLPVEIVENFDDYLLPDMQVFPPKDLFIQNQNGVKKMRFDTTFANVGAGPLELIGNNDTERGVTVAKQRIRKKDGTIDERVIGEFILHPTHGHWHVDRYAQFQLYTTDAQQPKVVAETDKFSFCIWDEHTHNLSLPNAPKTRQYPRCPKNIQGNSVGWGDTYTANTAGQEINISGVPDGKYRVRAVVNADNAILESNYVNNEAFLNIEILGNTLKILQD